MPPRPQSPPEEKVSSPSLLHPPLPKSFRKLIPNALRRYHRILQRALANSLQPVTTLGPPTPFRRRVGKPRRHQALVLHPVQSHVNRTQRDPPGTGQLRHLGL